MRRFVPVLSLILAGCAGAPEVTEAPPVATPPPVRAPDRSGLLGLTGQEVANKLGILPTLQIREGSSAKLQFRNSSCVLDAYLYPPARGGEPRVEYVDARSPAGSDIPESTCLAAFQAARS